MLSRMVLLVLVMGALSVVRALRPVQMLGATVDPERELRRSPSEAFVTSPSDNDHPSRFGQLLVHLSNDGRSDVLKAISEHVQVVQYQPHDTYLLFGSAAGLAWVEENVLSREYKGLRRSEWHSMVRPEWKISPLVSNAEYWASRRVHREDRKIEIESLSLFALQLADGAPVEVRETTENLMRTLMSSRDAASDPLRHDSIVGRSTYRIELAEPHTVACALLAARPDVLNIAPQGPMELFGERQALIMRGGYNSTYELESASAPSTVERSHYQWLEDIGIDTSRASTFVIDVVDDGLHDGQIRPSMTSSLNVNGMSDTPTRIVYQQFCTNDFTASSVRGHGSIDVGIIGAHDGLASGEPYIDNLGYRRGVGIAPFARVGMTKVFSNWGNLYQLAGCGESDVLVASSRLAFLNSDENVAISSNSWGCATCVSTYSANSQTFDALVRDTDGSSATGINPVTYVFSAGNTGASASTIGTPGNAKNVITVGASENYFPTTEDGPWTDGCATPPTLADSAHDIASFSSRGPAPGGRFKPEIVAPGTHIVSFRSFVDGYTGAGVCDAYAPPAGQTVFAESTGTSHSCPATAGAIGVLYQYLENKHLARPSPALTKAWLMATTTYLTGSSAGDTLPSNNQGMGLVNLQYGIESLASAYWSDQVHKFTSVSEESWNVTLTVDDGSTEVAVVVAFSDAAGAVGTSPQVNALDVRVFHNGDMYLANAFSGAYSVSGASTVDVLNNALNFRFAPGQLSGEFVVSVSPAAINGDGVPYDDDLLDQDFALYVTNVVETSFVAPPPTPSATSTTTDYSYVPQSLTPEPTTYSGCTFWNGFEFPSIFYTGWIGFYAPSYIPTSETMYSSWTTTSLEAHSGTYSAYTNVPANQDTPVDLAALVNAFQPFNASGLHDVQLTFWMKTSMSPTVDGACPQGLSFFTAIGAFTDTNTWTSQYSTNFPYNGAFKSGIGNNAAGFPAWCGTTDWVEVTMDLSRVAGEDVVFFLFYTSNAPLNWDEMEIWIDDVSVCGQRNTPSAYFGVGRPGEEPQLRVAAQGSNNLYGCSGADICRLANVQDAATQGHDGFEDRSDALTIEIDGEPVVWAYPVENGVYTLYGCGGVNLCALPRVDGLAVSTLTSEEVEFVVKDNNDEVVFGLGPNKEIIGCGWRNLCDLRG